MFKRNPIFPRRTFNGDHIDKLITMNVAAGELYQFTLSKYMEDNKLEEIPKSLENEITTKINALHEAGYIHGDLHEGNIVFNINNGEYDVRLIDFETLHTIKELEEDTDKIKVLFDFLGIDGYGFKCTLSDLIAFERKNHKQCEKNFHF